MNPAENYERHFVPAIGEPLAKDLVRAAALRSGERVLDVACGTGVVARLASRDVGTEGRVAGLDANPGMLAVASTVAPPDADIEWLAASAETIPVPDASFDVVTCQMGLQFMADRSAALGEMHRVLASGGRLLLNLPGPMPPLFVVMRNALERHAGREAAGFVDAVFSLHEAAEVGELVRDAGFHDVSTKADTRTLFLPAPEEFLRQYVHSTPLAASVGQMEDERRGEMEREVAAGWRDFTTDEGMRLDVRVVVASARK